MSQSVQGTIQCGVNLTTTFIGGTAGNASEINQIGTSIDSVGPGQSAGQQVSDCWSHTYTNVSAAFDLDLTNLPGIGSRVVDLSKVKIFDLVNSDPVEGHDITVGPGASNGFTALWDDATATTTVLGGMPSAGIVNGQPVGNKMFRTAFTAGGLTVDSTHKVITITPVTTPVTVGFTGGGGTGATAGTVTVTAGVITAIAVSAGGSGYTAAPTVTISGGGGSGATATAVLTGGAVTSITVTNGGTGYNLISSLTILIAG